MHLIFDTETTDKFNKNINLDDPSQSRICQLAFILLDKDFTELLCFSSLIKPDGWTITPGAQAIHGISNEMCKEYGIDIRIALKLFRSVSDLASYRIAHNSDFDTKMIDVECAFNQLPFEDWGDAICTMKLMTNICRIPTKWGFKWPKLSEAYNHCFGKTFDGAHNALCDVRACSEIFKWLIGKNEINLNLVH